MFGRKLFAKLEVGKEQLRWPGSRMVEIGPGIQEKSRSS
jgi:hypothetical protein